MKSPLFLVWLTLSALSPLQASEPLTLEKMGVMFVGGRSVPLASTGGRFGGGGSQTQIVDQAPVHFLVPASQDGTRKVPVVMIPGMGLTSYLYFATPDGRDGWAQHFARAGHPVYVLDEPGNAVSGFEVARITASEAPPRVMLWSNEMTWRRWGIGPAPGTPAENTRFPYQHIDQLHASLTAVMGGGGGRGGRGGGGRFGARSGGEVGTNSPSGFGRRRGRGGRFRRGRPTDSENGQETSSEASSAEPDGVDVANENASPANPKVHALLDLLQRIGPAVILVHSAAGPTGFEATRKRGDLVRGLVAVEVTGIPTDAEDIKRHFSAKPFLGIYGDNFELRPMQGRYEASLSMAEKIKAQGGAGEVIWLPKHGIDGNSHLLMQDNNNHEIASMIIDRVRAWTLTNSESTSE